MESTLKFKIKHSENKITQTYLRDSKTNFIFEKMMAILSMEPETLNVNNEYNKQLIDDLNDDTL